MNMPDRRLTIGVVIATCDRPDPLRACLLSLDRQTVLPDQTIIVDSSSGEETRNLTGELRGSLRYGFEYRHSPISSAARQRNLGVELLSSDLILFLDDDVVLEPGFIEEILAVFNGGADGRLAGVSGTIANQVYSEPRGLNRLLLGVCLGQLHGSFAGKVLGPAVNFLPADGADAAQDVEWLPSTCTSYRRDVFLAYRFENTFQGYSFAVDVHLSTRIGRKYRLVNTTRARVYHADLGKDTHRNWVALGESQVKNRHLIMTAVLGRTRLSDHIRLFWYEMVYTPLAWLAAGAGLSRWKTLGSLLRGKVNGFLNIWTARTPLGSRS
jgi:glycosyltransferase involved in cell wall biosynthesis